MYYGETGAVLLDLMIGGIWVEDQRIIELCSFKRRSVVNEGACDVADSIPSI